MGISTASANGGVSCAVSGGATRSQSCNTAACPVDCVGAWGSWGLCSATCGGGTQSQSYTISTASANGGTSCAVSGGATRSQSCSIAACPVDCVGAWGSWGLCSATCGGGTQSSTYTISTASANGGVSCAVSGGATRSQSCNTAACAAVTDCVGAWGPWGTCSATCGGGTQ